MSRSTTSPAYTAGPDKVLHINWRLLARRFRARAGQLFTSARHRAAGTEYIPPTWMGRLRLTWFRIGLIGLVLFVFTQKQIDFTFSIGADGLGVAADSAQEAGLPVADQTSALSMFFSGGSSTPAWQVDRYDAALVEAYVERFDRVAQTEEEKFRIPAPAKLAMAILESEAGSSPDALSDNNHFPVATPRHHFDNAWGSWRAHSQSIEDRYPTLAAESVNYQQWIAALGNTDYSSDPQYGAKLLQIIRRFSLDRI